MNFDWFLILLPIVLAVGALVKVLTSKPPAYQRKQQGDSSSTIAGSGGDESISIAHTSSDSRNKQEGDTSDSAASVGEAGGDGGD